MDNLWTLCRPSYSPSSYKPRRLHPSSPPSPRLTCRECNDDFHGRPSLEKHMQSSHNDILSTVKRDEEYYVEDIPLKKCIRCSTSKREGEYFCDPVRFRITHQCKDAPLFEYVEDKSVYKCLINECGLETKLCYSRWKMGQHISSDHFDTEDCQYRCIYCGRGFFTELQTVVHVVQCHRNNGLPCSDCQQFYESAVLLHRHRIFKHPSKETRMKDDFFDPMDDVDERFRHDASRDRSPSRAYSPSWNRSRSPRRSRSSNPTRSIERPRSANRSQSPNRYGSSSTIRSRMTRDSSMRSRSPRHEGIIVKRSPRTSPKVISTSHQEFGKQMSLEQEDPLENIVLDDKKKEAYREMKTPTVIEGRDYFKLPFVKQCSKCNEVFLNPMQFHVHKKCHSLYCSSVIGDKRYFCTVRGCQVSTLSLVDLGIHLSMEHYPDTDSLYQCQKCKERFFFKEDVVNHCKTHEHKLRNTQETSLDSVVEPRKVFSSDDASNPIKETVSLHTPSNQELTNVNGQNSTSTSKGSTEIFGEVDYTKRSDNQICVNNIKTRPQVTCTSTSTPRIQESMAVASSPFQKSISCVLTNHSDPVEGKDYVILAYKGTCEECGKLFDSPLLLFSHNPCCRPLMEKGERKMFFCPIDGCRSTQFEKRKIATHISEIHYKERDATLQCLKCGFRHRRLRDLITHINKKQCMRNEKKPLLSEIVVIQKKGEINWPGEDDGFEGVHYTILNYKKECSHCKEFFHNPPLFRRHQLECLPQHRNPDGSLNKRCPHCPAIYAHTLAFGQHLSHHHYKDDDYRYKCMYCHVKSWSHHMAVVHARTHHGIQTKQEMSSSHKGHFSFDCEFCSQSFGYYKRYTDHVKEEHHQFTPKEKTAFKSVADYECDSFSSRKKLRKDKNRSGRIVSSSTALPITIGSSINEVRFEEAKEVKCPAQDCLEAFTVESEMFDHVVKVHTPLRAIDITEGVHYEKKAFVQYCKACGLFCDSPSKLRFHGGGCLIEPTIEIKDNRRKIICSKCRKSFHHLTNYLSHVSITHFGATDKLYKCKEKDCSQEFYHLHRIILHCAKHVKSDE